MKVKALNDHIQNIVNGYKQQYHYYQQLLQAANQLSSALSVSDTTGVEANLQVFNQIAGNVTEIDNVILVHKQAVMTTLHLKEFSLQRVEELINPNLYREMTEYKDANRQVLSQLVEVTGQNEARLKGLMMKNAEELKSFHQHLELQQAYLDRPEGFPEPRFFDKRK